MNHVYLSIGLIVSLFITSCSMNWESGGNEEFMYNCKNIMEGEEDSSGEASVDPEATCDCLLKQAREEYDNYEDYLMSEPTFVQDNMEECQQ